MVANPKKRGRRFLRKFSRASAKASEEGKEHIKENLLERISHAKKVRLLIFEWSLLVFALIMLAITQAFWFGDSYVEDAFVPGGTYTEATIGEVNSLNPLFATTDSEKVLSKLLFATIATNDYSGHPSGQLAESITSDERGRRWTVKLRENLRWSDGTAITNDDVIFTTQLIQSPAVNTVYKANLANVKVFVDENNYIVFDLPAPYADFISALDIPIVPKHILGQADPKTLIENPFSATPTTSGAFRFNAEQPSANNNKIFYLTTNPDYYQGRTMLNSFAVHTYHDKTEVLQAVNAGEVTATAELSGSDRDKITARQFLQKESGLNSGAFIFFNTAKPPTDSLALRETIRQGLDLAKIRALAPETEALDLPILDSQVSTIDKPETPTFNFATAKERIAELNSENQLAPLSLVTVNFGYLPQIAEAVAEELRNLGLEVELMVYEENQDFITNIISKRSYDLLIYEIELGSEPDLLPYYHSSQASVNGLNLSNYQSALADDLLLGARGAMSSDLRTKKYEGFLRQWLNDVPAIGLYRANLTYFYNKNIRTFGNDVRLVRSIDRFSDITDWAVSKAAKNKTP